LLGGITTAGVFGGDQLLVAIAEVGSFASAIGWLATSASLLRLGSRRERTIALLGTIVAACFALLKIVPTIPGHFTRAEWIALLAWLVTGLVFRTTSQNVETGFQARRAER
jgi:hypothetical protein